MKLENQVTCRELSKKLKEAGYKQEGLWVWDDHYEDIILYRYYEAMKAGRRHKDNLFIAPTVSELLEKVPLDNFFTVWHMGNGKIRVGNPLSEEIRFTADTFADALAKMWLYLNENNLLEGDKK